MADSMITKQALASALKDLMTEMPFEKISVAHICEKCNMNRKSFYYHFKDKYDLVNWIFESEFVSVVMQKEQTEDMWEVSEKLADYFYENRNFYRKALKITGQNSFSEYFSERLHLVLKEYLENFAGIQITQQFTLDLLADICICAFKRWLLEKDCIPPKQFISIIRTIEEMSAKLISQEMENRQ